MPGPERRRRRDMPTGQPPAGSPGRPGRAPICSSISRVLSSAPLLCDPPVLEPEPRHARRPDLLACRDDPHKIPIVRAGAAEPDRNAIALADRILDRGLEIGKSGAVHREDGTEALNALREVRRGGMVPVAVPHQLPGDRKVALVQHLFEESASRPVCSPRWTSPSPL